MLRIITKYEILTIAENLEKYIFKKYTQIKFFKYIMMKNVFIFSIMSFQFQVL